MKLQKVCLFISCLFASSIAFSQIHQSLPATGGNATGTGGSSISFTVGQIAYSHKGVSEWTIAEGVQQPYEISVLKTAIENTEDITLEYKVFPNPAHEHFKLTIKPFNNENFKYRLYNDNGLLIIEKKIEAEETNVSIGDIISSIYFLNIYRDDKEVKLFKIVKI